MATLSEMRAIIADDLDRTDMSTQIDRAINRAIKFYAKEGFWFRETTGTFSTTASQKAYTTSTIPTDISEIDLMQVTVSGSDYPITEVSYQDIEKMDISGGTGIPSVYAYYNESIYLYPIPNSTYTITLSYKKTYSTLTLDADTNDWTTNAEDLIESRAAWAIYSRTLKDAERAASCKTDEMDALNALRTKSRKLTANSTSITPTDF